MTRTRRISGGAAVRCIRWFAGVSYEEEDAKRRIADMSGEWIPVTERMPEVGENVLWLVDEYGGFHHAIGCMGAGEKIFSDEGIQYWVTRKTYWMPLPAPPTDAK